MSEIAFKVAKDSKLYKNYFTALEEKTKMHNLAMDFFQKYNISEGGAYYQTDFLALQLTPEERQQFSDQVKKQRDENGMCLFKKKSAMQKEWTDSVCAYIDFEKLNCNRYWYAEFIKYKGRYNLWHKDDELYGFLECAYEDYSNLPEYMQRIPLSEYYAVIEGDEQ